MILVHPRALLAALAFVGLTYGLLIARAEAAGASRDFCRANVETINARIAHLETELARAEAFRDAIEPYLVGAGRAAERIDP